MVGSGVVGSGVVGSGVVGDKVVGAGVVGFDTHSKLPRVFTQSKSIPQTFPTTHSSVSFSHISPS